MVIRAKKDNCQNNKLINGNYGHLILMNLAFCSIYCTYVYTFIHTFVYMSIHASIPSRDEIELDW